MKGQEEQKMPKNPSRLPLNTKKLVLIADDEMINREILGELLKNDYELIYAADGREAVEQSQRHQESLALILLDLQMPVMTGMVVLKLLAEDAALSRIPVMVMTADQEAEVACLELGALDFIPKPYPRRDIVLARIRRIIELSEDRKIIRSTERDPLTGLYNREYFYSYAASFDQHHKSVPMDAIVVDVNHFHILNERYGRAYADQMLRRISGLLREAVQGSGGIVCRREADTFMIYCPHREDYQRILDDLSSRLEDEGNAMKRVRLRMGVYPRADKGIDLEQRFDRAKAAADTVRSNYTQNVSFYDEKLHERELFSEQLVEEFDAAIREGQFRVYYQPKFDIRPEQPILTSAEALVRWQHPRLGLVSPGVFIPLFESNGMIQKLDHYVWRETAAQVRRWKEEYGLSVPVSVNVSRVDMFDPHLVDTFADLLRENRLEPEDLLLEITESAYTDDADFIVSAVNALREIGLKVEMDDFGTGYSSLGMISNLPIDALKLDMMFVRNAFNGNGDVRMLELIIDIADYLGVPVIAEGVETREQLDALKAMGCDIVQGYYFSRPVPPEEFSAFVAEKKNRMEGSGPASEALPARNGARARFGGEAPQEKSAGIPEKAAKDGKNGESSAPAVNAAHPDVSAPDAPPETVSGQPEDSGTGALLIQALSRDYYSIYLVNTDSDEFIEYSRGAGNQEFQAERRGSGFFEKCRREVRRLVHPDDLKKALSVWEKDRLMEKTAGGKPFSVSYRLMFDRNPVHICCKVIRMTNAGHEEYIVIGISNTDDPLQGEQAEAATSGTSRPEA